MIHGVKIKEIKEQTADTVILEIFVPASSDYFDGHFPDFKLLPAVAQFELAVRFSARFFGTPVTVTHSKRIKFMAPVRPDSTILLELKQDAARKTVSFQLTDSLDKTPCSKGTIFIGGV
jgi:3-hydroxymyristoyl/3-hydroxydecanoyl-(acyl carrier protein) dehydratase